MVLEILGRGTREITGGKVASSTKFGSQFLLTRELVALNKGKIDICIKTHYSCLDKLGPDDATLPAVSCCAPHLGHLVGASLGIILQYNRIN